MSCSVSQSVRRTPVAQPEYRPVATGGIREQYPPNFFVPTQILLWLEIFLLKIQFKTKVLQP